MKHFHLVGIGGIGMSAIATLLLKEGFVVSGSDIKESALTDNLLRLGAKIFIGHNKENLSSSVEAVVFSSAVKEDNPELIEAKVRKISVYRRAEMLSLLMKGKQTITITGAHGKTTTTALIAYILSQAGLKPTVAIGGLIKNFSMNAWLGEGDYFVAEADESDGSFLNFKSHFSIITNIDKEHLDYYGSFDCLLDSFAKFIDRLEPNGLLIIQNADKNLLRLASNSGKHFKTFGLDRKAHIWADNLKILAFSCEFDCFLGNKKIGRVYSPLAGIHNVLNCLASILMGLELGIDFKKIASDIADFQGTKRRLDVKFKDKNLMIIDDYAHHPTEIQATLNAIRESIKLDNSYKNILAIFQPHRYSRTKLLLEQFGHCFKSVDQLVITDIYAACEQPLAGIDAGLLCQRIRNIRGNNVFYLERQNIINHILNHLSGSDVVIFLGAGDITKLADEFSNVIQAIPRTPKT
ncbi:MAG: UDP-N-acetylmuramate--L-alanine ligase [Candidatus Omnitrophota bacterium]